MRGKIALITCIVCIGTLLFSNYTAVHDNESPVYHGQTFEEWQSEYSESGFSQPLSRFLSALQGSSNNLVSDGLQKCIDGVYYLIGEVNYLTAKLTGSFEENGVGQSGGGGSFGDFGGGGIGGGGGGVRDDGSETSPFDNFFTAIADLLSGVGQVFAGVFLILQSGFNSLWTILSAFTGFFTLQWS